MRAPWLGLLALVCGCLNVYTVGGPGDSGSCPAGQVVCKDGCVVAGACEECADGQELCDGACVGAGTCDGGADCPAAQVKCGGECVAADTCPCEQGCDPDAETCVGGVCVCRGGLTRCGSGCVDIRADPAHCGGCGGECEESQDLCEDRSCVESCTAPSRACSGGCVDVETDALHCGACDKPCKSDELCVAGECRMYTVIPGCAACPCPDACGEVESADGGEAEDGECCDSIFIGAPVCVPDGCG